MLTSFGYTAIAFALLSCSETKQLQTANEAFPDSTQGLKDYYASFFPIGVAVSPRALKTNEASLVLQHFNSLTAENAMKMGPIHPKETEYAWSGADSIVAFAQRHQ